MKIRKTAANLVAIVLLATLALNVRAQAPDETRAKEDLRDAKAAARRHRAELMKIPHVRVVTGEIDGQHDAAILVEVDDQKNVDEVTRQLPSQLEGFPVEVDEDDDEDESPAASQMPTPVPPTVDQNGIYHHSWLPAPKPDESQ